MLQEISNRNGAVVLRNCTLELYQGKHIRLAVTKWGKLTPYPDNIASTPAAPSKINRERNFSLIDLSLVASETTEGPPHRTESYDSAQRSTSLSQQGGRNYQGQHNRGRNTMHRSHVRPVISPAQGMHYIDNSVPMGPQYGQEGAMNPYGSFGMPSQTYYHANVPSPNQDSALRAQMMQHHHHLRMQPSVQYNPRQPPSQRQNKQGRNLQPTSPMMVPSSSYPADPQTLHMPPPQASTPPGAYLMALQQQHPRQQPQQQQQQHPRRQQQQAMQHPINHDPGFMNPQATAFDPSSYPPPSK